MKKLYATYTGRRLNGSKIFYRFLVNGKKEVRFAKIRDVRIGNQYKIFKKDDSFEMASRPEKIEGPECSEQDVDAWYVADELVHKELLERRKAKAVERLSCKRLKKAVRPLLVFARDLDSFQTLEFGGLIGKILNDMREGKK